MSKGRSPKTISTFFVVSSLVVVVYFLTKKAVRSSALNGQSAKVICSLSQQTEIIWEVSITNIDNEWTFDLCFFDDVTKSSILIEQTLIISLKVKARAQESKTRELDLFTATK